MNVPSQACGARSASDRARPGRRCLFLKSFGKGVWGNPFSKGFPPSPVFILLKQKSPRLKTPRGRKISRYHPGCRIRNGHLTELYQARCHGNGASRSRLLISATLLRSETFPSVHTGLHRPPALCGEVGGKINSIVAFEKIILHYSIKASGLSRAFFEIFRAFLFIDSLDCLLGTLL